MADLDAALVQQFLDISVAERKMVIQPDGVLDDGHGEAVAVRLGIGHGGSAYPSPIKATQPPVGRRQYAERTPAMAIGITDTVWSALRLLGTVVLPTPCRS